MNLERVSGLDILRYRVQLTDAETRAPVVAGAVTMRLCQIDTTTPLVVDGGVSEVSLAHEGEGWWTADHQAAAITAAIAAVPMLGFFDRVLLVQGQAARRLARCRKVPLLIG